MQDEIELPQSIIDSFAKFLVPELRKFYESEEGKQILLELQAKQENDDAKNIEELM